ncbi:MAG: toprim domain-containing protein [Rhodobacteraceae bacterium]|nr:toprim domain-containing protein [Paracoccaceae bacterium]
MDAEAVTRLLGGRWHGSYGTACCPAHEDRHPSLSIKNGANGRLLLHCHAGCSFRDVADALEATEPTDAGRVRSRIGREAPAQRRAVPHSLLWKIWSEAQPVTGSGGERYFRARAINCELPASLRFANSLRHPTGAILPAIVAQVVDLDGARTGLHRTFLAPCFKRKADVSPAKAMLGRCVGGSARLRSGQGSLVVCEGIETGLSVCDALEPETAVWAALSTSGLKGLALPFPGLFGGSLLIASDGDSAGQKAALILAERAASHGWTAEIATAPDGQDFNDLARMAING